MVESTLKQQLTEGAPNPWSVVHEFTKTIVTVAAGFLAFTVTFSSKPVTNSRTMTTLLLLSWFLLVVAIALALVTAGRLHGFLRGKTPRPATVVLAANASYFALLAAAAVFFAYSLSAGRRKVDTDASLAVVAARAFVAHADSGFYAGATLYDARKAGGGAWLLRYRNRSDSLLVEVDANSAEVIRLLRL